MIHERTNVGNFVTLEKEHIIFCAWVKRKLQRHYDWSRSRCWASYR